MKKNLFGAVSAALALALAITSFGCESGNDSPVRPVEDVDRAAVSKSVFKYVATPSDYTYVGATVNKEYSTGGQGSQEWKGFEKGENKYNRNVENDAGQAYATSRGTVDGKTNGDVIETKKETISLNYDGTYSLVVESTKKEVFQILTYDYKDAGTTEYDTRKTWKSVKINPIHVVETATTGSPVPFAVAAPVVGGADGVVTPGEVVVGVGSTVSATWDSSIQQIENAIKAYDNVLKELNDAPFAKATEITSKTNAKAAMVELLETAKAARYGATQVVVESTTVDGETTTTTTYNGYGLKKTATSGTKAPVTGKYKFVNGNFKNGTIIITSKNKLTYGGDNGKYVDDNYTGNMEDRFPSKATNLVPQSVECEAGRTLTIAGGIITAPVISQALVGGSANYSNKFFLSSSVTSYDNAVAQHTAASTERLQNKNEVSYNYVCQF